MSSISDKDLIIAQIDRALEKKTDELRENLRLYYKLEHDPDIKTLMCKNIIETTLRI